MDNRSRSLASVPRQEAAEEYEVFSIVDELRSLSIELANGNLTTEDARQGAAIIAAFNKSFVGLSLYLIFRYISFNIYYGVLLDNF